MIKSMTGAARKTFSNSEYNIEIIIKSLNSKQCDVYVKSPKILTIIDPQIIKTIKNSMLRGKISVFINIEFNNANNININKKAVSQYINIIRKISEENNISDNKIDFSSLLRLPECVSYSNIEELSDTLKNDVLNLLKDTVNELDNMRVTEGQNIVISLNEIIEQIEIHIENIKKVLPESISNYKTKLINLIPEILVNEKEFEKKIMFELGVFADKVDINEELVRLNSHIIQLKNIISSSSEDSVGRTIEFLLQEMNREINTSSVKSQSSVISENSVKIKSLLDKLKEHSTNIV